MKRAVVLLHYSVTSNYDKCSIFALINNIYYYMIERLLFDGIIEEITKYQTEGNSPEYASFNTEKAMDIILMSDIV